MTLDSLFDKILFLLVAYQPVKYYLTHAMLEDQCVSTVLCKLANITCIWNLPSIQ